MCIKEKELNKKKAYDQIQRYGRDKEYARMDFMLEINAIPEIDKWAAKIGITRARYMRDAINHYNAYIASKFEKRPN